MHSDIENAYLKWRATVKDDARVTRFAQRALTRGDELLRQFSRPPTPSERARNAVKSFWQTLTPEQRSERQRKAAKKMWRRRKAEAR